MSLRINGVVKRFGGVTAVNGVSLDMPDGVMAALIGPNGSGKTTLFNVVAGLHRPTTGTVHYGDEMLSGRRPHDIARAGVVRTFQQRVIFEGMTVRQNVDAAASIAGTAEDAYELLDFVGLKHVADVPARSLAYGHARSLSIAIALATKPRMLLLDEPAAGLEHSESRQLARLLQRLHEEGQTRCWVIDHDMRFLMSFVDHVYVMDQGQLIAEGVPEEIRRSSIVRERYLGS